MIAIVTHLSPPSGGQKHTALHMGEKSVLAIRLIVQFCTNFQTPSCDFTRSFIAVVVVFILDSAGEGNTLVKICQFTNRALFWLISRADTLCKQYLLNSTWSLEELIPRKTEKIDYPFLWASLHRLGVVRLHKCFITLYCTYFSTDGLVNKWL